MGGRKDGYGGVQSIGVYEAYEVRKKRGKIRCLLLHRKKMFFFIFMTSLLWNFFKNGPLTLLLSPSPAPGPTRTSLFL
jgi:hypothetical protein